MTQIQKNEVKSLIQSGMIENIDFRVIYFGIYAEIKIKD